MPIAALAEHYGAEVAACLNAAEPAQVLVLARASDVDTVEPWRGAGANVLTDARADPLSLIESAGEPLAVVDVARAPAVEQFLALQTLFPLLGAGGLYVIDAPEDAVRDWLESLQTHCETRALFAMPDALTAMLAASMRSVAIAPECAIVQREGEMAAPSVRVWSGPLVPEPAASVANHVRVLDNGGRYERIPARIVGAPGWVAEAFNRRVAERVVEPPPACVALLTDVSVRGRGVIVTGDGRVVRESLINTAADPAFGPFRREPSGALSVSSEAVRTRFQDGGLVVLKQTWDNNFGHWMLETLPRVDLVAECLELTQCRFIVADDGPAMRQVQADSLALFGIEPQQIAWTPDDAIFCDRLFYPAPLTEQPWVKAPRVIRVLERLAGPPADGPQRLYVQRSASFGRRLLNEEALLPLLRARGFLIAAPERLSLADQLALFRDARFVVGTMGAALSLAAVSELGLTMFALATEFMQDDFFYDIVCHKRGRYFSLHGPATSPALGMQSDFSIDVALFTRMLDEALA